MAQRHIQKACQQFCPKDTGRDVEFADTYGNVREISVLHAQGPSRAAVLKEKFPCMSRARPATWCVFRLLVGRGMKRSHTSPLAPPQLSPAVWSSQLVHHPFSPSPTPPSRRTRPWLPLSSHPFPLDQPHSQPLLLQEPSVCRLLTSGRDHGCTSTWTPLPVGCLAAVTSGPATKVGLEQILTGGVRTASVY